MKGIQEIYPSDDHLMGLATSICQPRETITTMTVRPFMAILPQKTQVGDEIILKGRVKDDAQMYVYISIKKVF